MQTIETLFPLAKATELAALLNDTDGEGWHYTVVEVSATMARIDMYDDHGALVGQL